MGISILVEPTSSGFLAETLGPLNLSAMRLRPYSRRLHIACRMARSS